MKNLTESYKKRLIELAGIITESSDIYFDTLSGALFYVKTEIEKKGYEIENSDNAFFHFGVGGISYGQTKRDSFELIKDEKIQRKKLQVQIYRMDSGRYELNFYVA